MRIGPYSTSAAGVARLNLPGATMLVDPLIPHCIPTLEVSDASEAVEVIRGLYGSTVAGHVLDLERAAQEASDVVWVQGPELRDLNRLGHLIWLARSAPWPMPSTVLVAELIVAVDTCLVVLENPGDVSEAIAGYAGAMLTALPAALEAHASPPVVNRLADACRAISRHLPVTDAARPQLLAAIDAATASAGDRGGRSGGTGQMLVACTPTAAVHAGPADESMLHIGSATADWSRNSGGVVSRDEDAISWTVEIHPEDGAVVTVVATRALPEPPVGDTELPATSVDALIRAVSDAGWVTGRVAAGSVHTAAWPLALTEVVLTPHPETGDLSGSVTVRGSAAEALRVALRQGTLVVDVHDLGLRHAHLAGGDPTVEAARRWTARAVCASRVALSWPEESVAVAARGAWNRAMALWRHTGDHELAADRVRRCAAWLALMTAETEPGAPTPSTPSDLADVVAAADVAAVGMDITLSEVLAAGQAPYR
ncbi:MAG: hypothetical protein WAR57_08785 [Candidatus Phosphoribacter sp.]